MLQSELELQLPQTPLEHFPLPLQSELELQPPHLPPEHLPVLQSELELQLPHLPLEHLPWPLQSELELQLPHLPPEHLPKPAQSELELHTASSCGANSSSSEIDGSSSARSLSNTGTETGVTIGLGSLPQAARSPTMRRSRSFIGPSYHQPVTREHLRPTGEGQSHRRRGASAAARQRTGRRGVRQLHVDPMGRADRGCPGREPVAGSHA